MMVLVIYQGITQRFEQIAASTLQNVYYSSFNIILPLLPLSKLQQKVVQLSDTKELEPSSTSLSSKSLTC